MNFKNLSHEKLHKNTLAVVEKERIATIDVLMHLRENEKRMLYARRGHKDLKTYCVKELKYSEDSAWRRIGAMQVLLEVPEVEAKIESGLLSLTQVSMARTFFREVKATQIEKQEMLITLEGKSVRESERIMAEKLPETPRPKVKEKAIRGGRLEVSMILDSELLQDLEELGILMGKPLNKLELFRSLVKEKLEKLKSKKCRAQGAQKTETKFMKAEQAATANEEKKFCVAQGAPRNPAKKRSRTAPLPTQRNIREKANHQCQHVDPATGKRCEARHYLQIEHKIPFARGGTHAEENLELLCPSHNRLRAVQVFGKEKMGQYLLSLD